jgi:splicing factor 3A subunit 1
MNGMQNQA